MPSLKSQPRKHLLPTSLLLPLRTFLRPQNSLQRPKRLLMLLQPFQKLLWLLWTLRHLLLTSRLLQKLFLLPRLLLPKLLLLLQPSLPSRLKLLSSNS